MTRWKDRTARILVATAACAAVVAGASPAAAADASSTTVQASPSAATIGQSVNLTAMVTCPSDPSPGLGMTFFDGGDILATVPVSATGAAVFTASLTTVGTHTITAAYNGNDNCGASHAETTVVMSAAPVTPTQPGGGFCLLACGGLINFNAGDIHNEININSRNRWVSAPRSGDFPMRSGR
ncbi:Ig-like domain-containing protein [Streptomyces sp. NBC_01766]|uniref:Ig-like domain-containing protein n=1 Tax=Streptomyces sp. NBC_01766 TaxID=2975936 RepID=UPI002DDB59C6|nr:Ig-like domain-containing protein [Streptomyces sp. NBC_01766]WSC24410.1 Ig-like domain-containing protein [Streptomyces sp. NBC_01766]